MCQSKGSSSSLSRHRKSRSDSPVSNCLGQNPVSLFGSSSYRPSESSIGIGHPLSNYSQNQRQTALLEENEKYKSPDFAESVKRAQSIKSIDGKNKLKNLNLDDKTGKKDIPIFKSSKQKAAPLDGSFGESLYVSEIRKSQNESSISEAIDQSADQSQKKT